MGVTIEGESDVFRPSPEIEAHLALETEIAREGDFDKIRVGQGICIIAINELPAETAPFTPKGKLPVLPEVFHQTAHGRQACPLRNIEPVIASSGCLEGKILQAVNKSYHLGGCGMSFDDDFILHDSLCLLDGQDQLP